MNGHIIKSEIELKQVVWADAELESITILYDEIKLRILQTDGKRKVIVCYGYIGYQAVGIWDEVIISGINIRNQHDLIQKSRNAISARYADKIAKSGSQFRNNGEWVLLTIEFIDGSNVNLVSSEFSVDDVQEKVLK